MKRICFTVTNELRYDQRMQRICRSLVAAGYQVTLVGYLRDKKPALNNEPYAQHRLSLLFHNGPLKYIEYNIRLFFWLLFRRMDLVCAIDLDTIIPVYYVSRLKGIQRVYDAHELFTEQVEIISRPRIKKLWDYIERRFVPRFREGYSVAASITEELNRRYGVTYSIIRNLPVLTETPRRNSNGRPPQFLYFGAVNQARGFATLIPAMRSIEAVLLVCGDGPFLPELRKLIQDNHVSHKVKLLGMQAPESFASFSADCFLGICLYENVGKNHYLALPNKFFDYMQAGLPQLAMQYPEMEKVNRDAPVAVLLNKLSEEELIQKLNNLLENAVLYSKLEMNCLKARLIYNWQQEEPKLLSFYKRLLTA